jgi:hypothetical protein
MATVLSALSDVERGVRSLRIEGQRIYLTTQPGTLAFQAALTIYSTLLDHEGGHPGSHPAEEIEDADERENLVAGIQASSFVTWDNRLGYRATPEIVAFCRDLAMRATRAHTLPLNVTVAGYSLGDVRQVFRALYQRTQVHMAYCWYRSKAADTQQVCVTSPCLP